MRNEKLPATRTGALRELMQRADMVRVDVGGDRQHRLARRQVERGNERRQPHAGVNHEVEIAAFEVIEIRPEVVVQERFGKCDEVRAKCRIR